MTQAEAKKRVEQAQKRVTDFENSIATINEALDHAKAAAAPLREDANAKKRHAEEERSLARKKRQEAKDKLTESKKTNANGHIKLEASSATMRAKQAESRARDSESIAQKAETRAKAAENQVKKLENNRVKAQIKLIDARESLEVAQDRLKLLQQQLAPQPQPQAGQVQAPQPPQVPPPPPVAQPPQPPVVPLPPQQPQYDPEIFIADLQKALRVRNKVIYGYETKSKINFLPRKIDLLASREAIFKAYKGEKNEYSAHFAGIHNKIARLKRREELILQNDKRLQKLRELRAFAANKTPQSLFDNKRNDNETYVQLKALHKVLLKNKSDIEGIADGPDKKMGDKQWLETEKNALRPFLLDINISPWFGLRKQKLRLQIGELNEKSLKEELKAYAFYLDTEIKLDNECIECINPLLNAIEGRLDAIKAASSDLRQLQKKKNLEELNVVEAQRLDALMPKLMINNLTRMLDAEVEGIIESYYHENSSIRLPFSGKYVVVTKAQANILIECSDGVSREKPAAFVQSEVGVQSLDDKEVVCFYPLGGVVRIDSQSVILAKMPSIDSNAKGIEQYRHQIECIIEMIRNKQQLENSLGFDLPLRGNAEEVRLIYQVYKAMMGKNATLNIESTDYVYDEKDMFGASSMLDVFNKRPLTAAAIREKLMTDWQGLGGWHIAEANPTEAVDAATVPSYRR